MCNYVAIVSDESYKHEGALKAIDFVATFRDNEKDECGAYKHDKIYDFETAWCDSAKKCDWKAEYNANIEDIATDDITNKKLIFTALGCLDGCDKLW